MNTYIIAIVLSYFITRFLADKIYNFSKNKNLLTYPDSESLYPTPVLNRFTYIIIMLSSSITFSLIVLINNKFQQMFLENINNVICALIIIFANIFIFKIFKNYIVSSIVSSILDAFITNNFINDLTFFNNNFSKYNLIFTFLWFLFFFVIFKNKKKNIGETFISNFIIFLTLSFLCIYLGLFFNTLIFLIISMSVLCLYRFSHSPVRIIPSNSYSIWFLSIISFFTLISNLKMTILALLLFIPLIDFISLLKNKKSLSFSLLKSGLPEKKVNFYIMAIQIISGIFAFITIHMKNEIISFAVFSTLFIILFIITEFINRKK